MRHENGARVIWTSNRNRVRTATVITRMRRDESMHLVREHETGTCHVLPARVLAQDHRALADHVAAA